jgi:hypothetical protein
MNRGDRNKSEIKMRWNRWDFTGWHFSTKG